MNLERLQELKIDPAAKRRSRTPWLAILLGLAALLAAALYLAWPRASDSRRVQAGNRPAESASSPPAAAAAPEPARAPQPASRLTVSGYLINRERIELSPRFQGVVAWIGVNKGDRVQKGQIVVRLEDRDLQARVDEAEAVVQGARVAQERAELAYQRVKELWQREISSREAEEESRLAVEAARAELRRAEAAADLAHTQLSWTVIASPIDGVVLEKLVEAGELVTPQSFGGGRGPSTALLAVADPNDLQVEIDVNESDLPRLSLGQACRVIPEAYPDRHYEGVVAEISPEANRQKGTLQAKVRILRPDTFLTPELSARVEFPEPEPAK